MKFSTTTALFALAASPAAAFVPRTPGAAKTKTQRLEQEQPGAEPTQVERTIPEGNSLALPWMKRPALLDGSWPGDAGFDPLGLHQ